MAHASPQTISVVDAVVRGGHLSKMLGTRELLDALERRGVSQADMARVLRLPSSRISEMYAGKRQVKLDEAKKLVEAFDLEKPPSLSPVSEQTARLLVLHIASRLHPAAMGDEALVEELTQDFQAFSRFARSQLGSPSPEATMGFLEGRRSERAPRPTTRTPRPSR